MSIGGATPVCGNGSGQVNSFAAHDLGSALKKKKIGLCKKKKKKKNWVEKKKKKKKRHTTPEIPL